jgi:hypothetical protein
MKLLNIHPGVQKLGCATEQVKRPARKLYALERLLDLASQSKDRGTSGSPACARPWPHTAVPLERRTAAIARVHHGR